jgi:hypothetical protein
MQDPIEEHLKKIIADLNDLGVPYALVGGLAYGARAEPRFTRDIDLTLLADSDETAEQITGQLVRCGYIPEMELANRHTGKLATFRMRYRRPLAGIPVDQSPYIDLLFSHCGIEKETIHAATQTEPFPGVFVSTATVPYLLAMKVLSESDRRLQDRIDLQNLIAVATEEDLALVPGLLDLIAERGFANNKDLHAVFEKFRQEDRDAHA